MIQRFSIGLLSAAGLMVAALEDPASARSVSAASGAVFYANTFATVLDEVHDNCLVFDFDTGAALSDCYTYFHVPLTTDKSGTKTLTFSGRAPSRDGEWAARCTAVAWDRFRTSVSASDPVDVSEGEFIEARTTGSVVVPSMGLFYALCFVNPGTQLYEFDHSP